ncbi:MAG TPA: methyltransferase domain-containing protein [Candidatus Pacearchaeota archaeon]|nr:methyltransferase domain-containing protein [Candidatus Pacearchaeota archaeon]
MKNSNYPPIYYDELVEEISELLKKDKEIIKKKVWLEALNPGYNVKEDAVKYGITPYVYNSKMESFYRDTAGFIFETSVEFCRPGKQEVLKRIKQRINEYLKKNSGRKINILMLGDGIGSDTIYLYNFYKKYANFFYFDVPGSKTFDFAMKRFKKYQIDTKLITVYKDIPKNYFDVVVSLEVLEHLPNPEESIRDISEWLKIGGIALITESFANLSPNLPTHLKSNLKYAGKTPLLFLRYNLFLTYYSNDPILLFRPMEFTKKEKTNLVDKYNLFSQKVILKEFIKGYIKRCLIKIKRI